MIRLALALGVVTLLLGCTSSRAPSPLAEMMAASARGEVACVRNDVVMRGRESCR